MRLQDTLEYAGVLGMLGAGALAAAIIKADGWDDWPTAAIVGGAGIVTGLVSQWMGRTLRALETAAQALAEMNYREKYHEEIDGAD